MSGERVLVVDDSDITRALLTRTLERAGFQVAQARDGLEGALVALRELPAAVVTDLEMPILDGYQLLRLLKSDPASAGIPVLIVTSHGEAPSRYWGLRTGADAYLTKDHEAGELVATVARLVASSRGAAAIPGPPPGPMDILARLVRQLDASLLQATLISTLLERGVAGGNFSETNLIALRTLADVADARALAVAVAEADAVTLHILLPQELSHRSVDQLASATLAALPVTPGATIEVVVHGDRNDEGAADLASLVVLPLPLRDASGVLTVLPVDGKQFAALSRHLVQAIVHHLAMVLDNARLSQRLRELSMLDGLTRVLNHRAIHERLTEELGRARRYGHPLAVVICDLDHFKRVNDSHGHLAGDAALRGAAQAMRRCMRAADSLGRYGGEEFLAVLPESDLEAARRAAERLRRAVAETPIALPAGGTISLTGSFGAAARAEIGEGATADALVSLADARLYEAKAAGRNRVRP